MDLTRPLHGRTRSISAENPTGEFGQGGRAARGSHSTAYASEGLPIGWKKSPCIDVAPHASVTIADITGPGVIRHIWITTLPQYWRRLVLSIHWDDDEFPSIYTPLGDFFCQGWASYAPVASLPITVAPAGGLNSYWEMPFASRARVTLSNLGPDAVEGCFFQITWTDESVPDDSLRLHAQWRRSDPLGYLEPHTIANITGGGHYVGTYLAWETHHPGWWGEGAVKFFIDDDDEFPSINGTGTEDYFGGAWSFEDPPGHYADYTTPYLGMPQVIEPTGFYHNQQRFGLYRWHIQDPITFRDRLSVTVQALGFRTMELGKERYRPLQDDISSVAYYYLGSGSAEKPAELTLDRLDLS